MPRYVIDMESDGLLDVVTKIHVIGWHNLDTGKSGTITDYKVMRVFLSQKDLTLICHNLYRFDKPCFEKILGITLDCRLIDSLVLSWYLEPTRERHGLAFYGEEFGVLKPEIDDWEGLSIEEYVNRVTEDVKINLLLFRKQLAQLNALYDNDASQVKKIIGYLNYKMDCAAEQEEMRWKLDVVKCLNNLDRFQLEYIRKEESLALLMPENIQYKTLKKPKIMQKKDLSLSKRGENWLSLLDELGLDEDTLELKIEKLREIGNPQSHKQLKEWLFALGWIPVTFKYEKEGNGVRKIPQVSLPRGEGLCPSVKLLYEAEPGLEELDMLYVIKHRIGLLKGFLRDVNEDGYIQAKISGLTNTLRFKHSVVVNLPGYTGKGDWRDGEHIRGCLTVPEGYTLCGSDMSSLEDRTKQHYMYYFDPDYVKAMNVKGFDPHLDLAEFGYKMTNGKMGIMPSEIVWFKAWNGKEEHSDLEYNRYNHLKKERHLFKTTNYGAVYGVGGPTMSRTTGMPLEQCIILLKAYWQKNWSVKEIAKACTIKKMNHIIKIPYMEEILNEEGEVIETVKKFRDKEIIQMWLLNPVSKFWYSLRYMKDRFSTLNQGTGTYAFDRWVKGCRDEGIKMCGQFHDEIVTPTLIGDESKVEKILRDSIVSVNKELKLNRALDIDIQFGDNYAQIH